MSTMYPLLKPADWELRAHVPHWRSAGGAAGAPLVVAARNLPTGFDIVTQASDANALWAEAATNLRALQYNWEVSDMMGLPLVTCSGQDFAAEKVLDPAAMQHVQQLLRTDRLLVAVPRRTCLSAVPQQLSPQQHEVFTRIVRLTYADDSFGNAPISPGAFIVEQGNVTGFVPTV